MGRRNYLVEGVSGTGKTSVGDELQRRGCHAVHGDRELAYQGDPSTGAAVAGGTHEHHLWRVAKVRAVVADQDEAVTFFCGGSRNFPDFIGLFDGVFVLEVDLDTLRRRLAERPDDEFGGRPSERELIERLHESGEDTPDGIVIDATAPLARVVDQILDVVSDERRAGRSSEAVPGEQRLEGGNAGGAVLVDGTVRRATGPWTPAVHALLRHLEQHDFDGAPRVLGIDEQDREILTFLPGLTVGAAHPWPVWVHSDDALREVGAWLRRYHDCVRGFVPPPDACWRIGSYRWEPGSVVGHNDAAPYNAVWRAEEGAHERLVGFIDWDFAAPCPPVWDLAFTAFSWVPLHAREVVEAEGSLDLAARPRRLRLLLDAYGWTGSVGEVLDAVLARVLAHVDDVRALADAGDPLFRQLVDSGVLVSLQQAMRELEHDRVVLETGTDQTRARSRS